MIFFYWALFFLIRFFVWFFWFFATFRFFTTFFDFSRCFYCDFFHFSIRFFHVVFLSDFFVGCNSLFNTNLSNEPNSLGKTNHYKDSPKTTTKCTTLFVQRNFFLKIRVEFFKCAVFYRNCRYFFRNCRYFHIMGASIQYLIKFFILLRFFIFFLQNVLQSFWN